MKNNMGKDIESHDKYEAVIKFAKKKLTSFKVDERRKVY